MLTHCRILRALKDVSLVEQDGYLFREGDRFIEYPNMPGYFYRFGGSMGPIGLPFDAFQDDRYIEQGFFIVESTIPARETPYWAEYQSDLLIELETAKEEMLRYQERYFQLAELLSPPAPRHEKTPQNL